MSTKNFEELVYIINYKNRPTIKQCRETSAYKFSDNKFKNIALSMYRSMIEKKLQNDSLNINSIILSVFNGYKMAKARKILLEISRELKDKIIHKNLEKSNKEIKNISNDTEINYNIHDYNNNCNDYTSIITQEDIDNWENL